MTSLAAAPEQVVAQAVRRHADLVRRDRVLQVALVLIAAQLALRAWGVYGGWFVLDDFNFIARMGHDGLDPVTAARSYNGHVMPGGMYLSWLNHVLAPWQWWLPATELLAMQAAADLGLLWLLVSLHGRRPGILPPLAIFLFSVITLEGAVWWAAAINLLPFEIALFAATTAHLAYLRTGRLRHAWQANGWIAAGLLFNERSALIYVVIAVFTFCYFAEGYGWRRVASATKGRLRALSVYVGTGAAYVAVYVLAGRSYDFPELATYPTVNVVRTLVLREYLPTLVGGPLRWDQFGVFVASDAPDAVVLAAAVTLALVLNELLRHRVRAARGLALPVLFLVIDVVLVLRTQVLTPGDRLVFDYRFQGEMAAMTALALALVSMPVSNAAASSARRSGSELLDHPRRVAVLVSVTTVLAVVSSVGLLTAWHSDPRGKEWVQTATRALGEARAPVPIVDRAVPEFVMAPIDGSHGLASRLLVGEPNADWVTVDTDDLRAFDDRGRLLPVAIAAVHAAVPGPDPGCGYRIAGEATTIGLDAPATGAGLWVRIGYLSTGTSPVRVTVGDRTVDTTILPGLHALFVRGGSSFDSVQVSGLDDPTFLCTNDVTVGVPQPYDPEGASQP